MSKTQIWIIVAVIAAAIIIGWLFYSGVLPGGQEEAPPPTDEVEGLGAEIYSETGAGAASDIPAANPTANPIEGVYKNPFE